LNSQNPEAIEKGSDNLFYASIWLHIQACRRSTADKACVTAFDYSVPFPHISYTKYVSTDKFIYGTIKEAKTFLTSLTPFFLSYYDETFWIDPHALFRIFDFHSLEGA